MLPLKNFMLETSSVLGVLVQGLRSNLSGLACPFYCTGPSVSLALSFFLLGFLCGCGLCAWFLLRFDIVPMHSSTLHPAASAPSVPPVVNPRAATCMGHNGADLEISLEIGGLWVTVSGPSAAVCDFVQYLSAYQPRARSPDPFPWIF